MTCHDSCHDCVQKHFGHLKSFTFRIPGPIWSNVFVLLTGRESQDASSVAKDLPEMLVAAKSGPEMLGLTWQLRACGL